jgi:hypothetical protein
VSLQRSLPTLPSRYRGPAFRAIESVLREDPVLSAFVRTWRSREGLAGETSLPVSADQLPLVALSPIPNPSTILGVDETKINFAVKVELAVGGTCAEDIFALWEAVEDAVVGSKPFRGGTVQSFLCGVISNTTAGPAGVNVLRPSAPGFAETSVLRATPAGQQPVFQGGVGTLTCFLRRPA